MYKRNKNIKLAFELSNSLSEFKRAMHIFQTFHPRKYGNEDVALLKLDKYKTVSPILLIANSLGSTRPLFFLFHLSKIKVFFALPFIFILQLRL